MRAQTSTSTPTAHMRRMENKNILKDEEGKEKRKREPTKTHPQGQADGKGGERIWDSLC